MNIIDNHDDNISSNSLISNLKYLMKVNGNLTVSRLAKYTNVPQPTLHHMLDGTTKNPRHKALQAIADYFAVSVSQLIGEMPLPAVITSEIEETYRVRALPVLSWEQTKLWPNIKSEDYKENILVQTTTVPNGGYGLLVDNNNYEPLFPRGTLLILDPNKLLLHKDYVLIRMLEDDQISLQRLFIDGKEYYIKVEEKGGDAKLIKLRSDKHIILAAVVEARLSFNSTSAL